MAYYQFMNKKYPILHLQQLQIYKEKNKFWFKGLLKDFHETTHKITFGCSTPQYYKSTLGKQSCMLSVSVFIQMLGKCYGVLTICNFYCMVWNGLSMTLSMAA